MHAEYLKYERVFQRDQHIQVGHLLSFLYQVSIALICQSGIPQFEWVGPSMERTIPSWLYNVLMCSYLQAIMGMVITPTSIVIEKRDIFVMSANQGYLQTVISVFLLCLD